VRWDNNPWRVLERQLGAAAPMIKQEGGRNSTRGASASRRGNQDQMRLLQQQLAAARNLC